MLIVLVLCLLVHMPFTFLSVIAIHILLEFSVYVLTLFCKLHCLFTIVSLDSLFQAFRQWGAARSKKGALKNKSEGGGEVREGTPVRFVLNRLFRPFRPHQLQVVFTCQSRLVLHPDTFIIFLANKSKFVRSKINIMYT